MLKILATLITTLALTSGCVIANRSVVHFEHQNAETGATVTDNGKRGASSVAAEKTTEASTAVNTSSGTANAKQDEGGVSE